MQTAPAPFIDPWRFEIIVVRDRSHTGGERAGLSRDVESGLLIRLRQGVYVERAAFESLSPEHQHVVRMRALAAVSDAPVLFSHFSAAVAQGRPVLRTRLQRLHIIPATSAAPAVGIAPHRFAVLPTEIMQLHDLLVTTPARTVVDVAGAGSMEEGVMVADAVLHAGAPRSYSSSRPTSPGPDRRSEGSRPSSSSRIRERRAPSSRGAGRRCCGWGSSLRSCSAGSCCRSGDAPTPTSGSRR